MVAMLVGPALMAVSRRWPPEFTMMAALCAYALVIVLAWVVFLQVAASGRPSAGWTGLGIAVGVVAWSAGLIRSARRMRLLLWADAQNAPDRAR